MTIPPQRVLVTRPEGDAQPFAEALAARGHQALIDPVMHIVFAENSAPLDGAPFVAVLATSANGVRALARRSQSRNVRLFVVGHSSAEIARVLGFTTIETGPGNGVDGLKKLLFSRVDPSEGRLLYVCGRDRAGNLELDLRAAHYDVACAELYRAEAALSLRPETLAALHAGRLDAVTFFSRRAATIFGELSASIMAAVDWKRLHAVCVSDTVSQALALPFGRRSSARDASAAAMIAALEA